MLSYLKIGMVCLGLLVSSTANAVSVTAHSWLVADHKGKIIDGENTEQVRSIASITKLITVMVVLDAQQDLKELLGPHSREDLIRLSLIKSDNKSAQILCDNYPTGRAGCIRAMNNKVHSIGLTETRFVEPTGLSVMNVSTASELVTVVLEAQHYPQIVEASQSSHVKIQVRKKWVIFKNTNPIIGKRHHFIVSKTGYINASGGCIVMMLDTDVGRRIVVVLGSKNTHTRIPEAEFIAQH
jgi:D-alanyl-D-alanine endopeptidase (penicillin-binding protein 7)